MSIIITNKRHWGKIKQHFVNPAIVTCKPKLKRTKISVDFSQKPCDDPGIYVVYLKAGGIPFYVGESSNLHRRLTHLFRCHRSDNPHPCHRRHRDVWGELPDCETFCDMYGVCWYSTKNAFGRLEAEEELQEELGTNRKEYYSNFNLICANHSQTCKSASAVAGCINGLRPSRVASVGFKCSAKRKCNKFCPVWNELIANSLYRGPDGFQVPTMTGRKDPLFFHTEGLDKNPLIRVWRVDGSLNFTFDENDCQMICQRFEAGLAQGRSFCSGGTSYFNDPAWKNRPLTIITAPYAAAVIRYARNKIGLPV